MSERRTGGEPARRGRLIAFAVTALACVVALVAYLVVERARGDAAEPGGPQLSVQAVQAVPHLLVRDTRSGPSYGDIALIPLSDPGGPRAVVPVRCERVAATPTGALCLQQTSAVGSVYRAVYLDRDFHQTGSQDLPGIPSRARLSGSGTWAAWTVFRSGQSYADAGFSTQTEITQTAGQKSLGDLETWTATSNGVPVTATDRNFWGVTFIGDGPGFYATMGTGGQRYLVRGDISTRTMTVVTPDGACPSVSEDGRTVVMKAKDPATSQDRFVALDLATGRRTPLADEGQVDDQAAWDGPDTVLYASAARVLSGNTFDIWAVPTDGTRAHVLVHDAASPSVVGLAR
jgi:hypothetical protein